jgi:serine/threonine-protein kinase
LGFVDVFVCSVATVLITISTVEYRGIASPLAMGVVMVLLCRSILFAHHWRRGIVAVGTMVLLYPLTYLILAAVSPYIAAQFANASDLSSFALNFVFIAAAGAVVVAGGHTLWSLRLQVYQSRSFGRYRLKRRIGAGGMGEVWLAHHDALKRDVAVKVLRAESAADEKAIARFEREVRATSELKHPNTVRVFDYGVTHDGLFYYAMELLGGSDLHDVISRKGPMHPVRAARIMAQAARALAEAHHRGIIHRDIKPENLYLTQIPGEGDFVKVLDFGLAKVLAPEGGDLSLTQVGWAVGTPQWVSPEVVLGHEADARSDLYGLGAVLYFLLCGQAPHNYRNMQRIMQAHLHGTVKPPSYRLGRALPRGIEEVVMRCLSKNPGQRYADARELAAALERCCDEDPQTLDLDQHFGRARAISPELPAVVAANPGWQPGARESHLVTLPREDEEQRDFDPQLRDLRKAKYR